MLLEELSDPKLVDFASERVQILVPRAIHGPELFRFACLFEQGHGLVQWRVCVMRSAIKKIATITVPTNHIIQKMYSRLDPRLFGD